MSTTAYQIIAVDFDGTLCYSNWPELGEPNRPLIEYLINQKRSGNKLILWTCRAGEALETGAERLGAAGFPRCQGAGERQAGA